MAAIPGNIVLVKKWQIMNRIRFKRLNALFETLGDGKDHFIGQPTNLLYSSHLQTESVYFRFYWNSTKFIISIRCLMICLIQSRNARRWVSRVLFYCYYSTVFDRPTTTFFLNKPRNQLQPHWTRRGWASRLDSLHRLKSMPSNDIEVLFFTRSTKHTRPTSNHPAIFLPSFF